MNMIRSVLIGLLTGGGFGAQLGTALARHMEESFSILFQGFEIGGTIGALLALSVVLAKGRPKISKQRRKAL